MEHEEELLIDVGVATLTLEGQSECGDSYLVKHLPGSILLAVVDGLGHGDEAARASAIAIEQIESSSQASIPELIQECHRVLRNTRGVVMSLALFRAADRSLTWMGIGNVEGVLLRGSPSFPRRIEILLLRAGVVGAQIPEQSPAVLRIESGDTLILATDGIRRGFGNEMSAADPPKKIADRILARHSRGNDDALVLVARFR